jgi:hypothetical protein
MNPLLPVVLAFAACIARPDACLAQEKISPEKVGIKKIAADTADFPYWIDMMEDPEVNYFQAVRAFDLYWAKRVPPAEKSNEARNIFSTEEAAMKTQRPGELVFEYRKFLNWQQSVKNLVDDKGHILTAEEIIKIWEQNKR